MKKSKSYLFDREKWDGRYFAALNWYVNRGRIPVGSGFKEYKKAIRRMSHRRAI